MRRFQRVVIAEKQANGRYEFTVPDDVDISTVAFYSFAGHAKIPSKIVFQRTIGIIHDGHDYQFDKKTRKFATSRPEVAQRILMEWGEEVQLSCSKNHPIDENHNYCVICGEFISDLTRELE